MRIYLPDSLIFRTERLSTILGGFLLLRKSIALLSIVGSLAPSIGIANDFALYLEASNRSRILILGVRHGGASAFQDKQFFETIEKSDVVVLEGNAWDSTSQQVFANAMGEISFANLAPNLQASVERAIAVYDLPSPLVRVLRGSHPFATYNTLRNLHSRVRREDRISHELEAYKRFKTIGKAIRFLETPHEAGKIIANLSLMDLENAIEGLLEIQSKFNGDHNLFDWIKNGSELVRSNDAGSFCKSYSSYFEVDSRIRSLETKTIHERNSQMAKRIAEISVESNSQKNITVLIGALHLCGEFGLLQKMRQLGLEVLRGNP